MVNPRKPVILEKIASSSKIIILTDGIAIFTVQYLFFSSEKKIWHVDYSNLHLPIFLPFLPNYMQLPRDYSVC